MDNLILKERERKCKVIVGMYESRKYRQQDIADKLYIPVSKIREVLQAFGFEHGKEKSNSNPNNLNSGQSINPIIDYKKFDFLDEYNF